MKPNSFPLRGLTLGAAVLGAALFAQAAAAQTAIKFSLDWKFEGPAAGFLAAIDEGHYKKEGLDVSIDTGQGSLEAIPRVASGTYQIGFADINSLVKFRDKNPNIPIKGIMMVYDAPPFAIVSLRKSGIAKPKDLEGKILGAPAPDGAYAQWKAFTAANGIDASKVKIENVGFPVREPMLAEGKVDAITGFSFSSFMNLTGKGVKPEDINVMLMSNHGLVLYGNVVIVNPDFAARNPEAVKKFVKATLAGWRATVASPEKTVKYVLARNDVAREPVELERLKMALRDNVLTAYVKANGMGGVDWPRLEKSIDQIALTYDFTARPKAADVFTDVFLPPPAERKIN